MLIDAYLLSSKADVILPKIPTPLIGMRLDGRKVAFASMVGGGVLHTLPNSAVLIPPGTQTHWMPAAGTFLAGVFIGGKAEEAIRTILRAKDAPVVLNDAFLAANIRQLVDFAVHQGPPASRFEACLVDCLVAHLEWLASAPLTRVRSGNTSSDAAMSRILLFIDNNLEAPLTIDMLAAKAHISAALFRRRFTEATGMTVHHYVLKARIDRAREFIAGSQATLVSVAAQCGFSSQSHMTKVFHRELGATPAELRRSASASPGPVIAREMQARSESRSVFRASVALTGAADTHR
jgi:AraC family transcriptional regulator